MPNMAFDSRMYHRCTIVQSSRGAGGASDYGHQTPNPAVPVATYPNIICRIRPATEDDRTETGWAGTVIGEYVLYIAKRHMPASMAEWYDADVVAAHTVKTIVFRKTGLTVDPGPFAINGIMDAAYAGEHFRFMLRRVA